jgi:hypothetical protein
MVGRSTGVLGEFRTPVSRIFEAGDISQSNQGFLVSAVTNVFGVIFVLFDAKAGRRLKQPYGHRIFDTTCSFSIEHKHMQSARLPLNAAFFCQ